MDNLPVRDRMAVVFHGIVGGMNGRNGVGLPISVSDCAKTIKHNVISTYDCDVFVHTWSMDQEGEIMLLYNPVSSLFQSQEYFGFTPKQVDGGDIGGMAFRTVSRYTSLERALNLKQEYEKNNGFKYRWVIVLRFDLVFFTKLNLLILNNNSFYVCKEPHWPEIQNFNMVHDIVFLSNSNLMDKYGTLANDFRMKKYDPASAHHCARQKLAEMFNNNLSWVKYCFNRYEDVEIYRLMSRPEQNPVGHAYGALQTKNRFEKLLEEIDKYKYNEK